MGDKFIELKDKNSKWHETLNVSSTAELGRLIKNGGWYELVMLSEAMQERNISKIADEIYSFGYKKKMLLISGPSSSGKTTFAKRLSLQLRVLGLSPVIISLDNYYLEKDKVPLDNEGKPNFECITALDLNLLNEHLFSLVNGSSVTLPVFDFKIGRRRMPGRTVDLMDNNIILIEGIHSLNDKLASSISNDMKFKIYISPASTMRLSGLSRDLDHVELRLLRRIVRDFQFRNSCVTSTISMWPSVRRGEDSFIYPFMETADIMFNTHLAYELCVLRTSAQVMLELVPPSLPAWDTAQSLIKILNEFPPMSDEIVPGNSILREFIGNSLFNY